MNETKFLDKGWKSKDLGDLEHVLFRTTSDWSPQRLKSYRWWIGGINKEYEMIGELNMNIRKKQIWPVYFRQLIS